MYRVVYNGYNVQDFDTMKDCESYMESILREHLNLNPVKIIDTKVNTTEGRVARVIVYRYYTMFEESFTTYKL